METSVRRQGHTAQSSTRLAKALAGILFVAALDAESHFHL